jgi:Dihydrofolate reductase
MISGHVFIATSLDGFIAREDDSLDWLPDPADLQEDHGFDAFMDSVDGVVMGRGSFEVVRGMSPWLYSKPVVVMSATLADVPAELSGKAEITRLAPRDLMAELEGRGWRRVYVDGGAVIRSFLREGLIMDLLVTRVPVLIGSGKPLFGTLPRDVRLAHVETKTYPSGLVGTRYRVLSES